MTQIRTLAIAIAVGLSLLSEMHVCHAQQTLFIVRHAERLNNAEDSPLSAVGEARAKTLARMLKDAKIAAVYSSEFQRTIQTAKPLADQLGLEVKTEFKGDADAFAKLLADRHPQGAVLVVGHSDTVPNLLKSLERSTSPPITIAPKEFDNLFVVVTPKAGPPTVVRLRYGD